MSGFWDDRYLEPRDDAPTQPTWLGRPWTPGVTYRQEADTNAETLRVLLLREAGIYAAKARDIRAGWPAMHADGRGRKVPADEYAMAGIALILALMIGGDS